MSEPRAGDVASLGGRVPPYYQAIAVACASLLLLVIVLTVYAAGFENPELVVAVTFAAGQIGVTLICGAIIGQEIGIGESFVMLLTRHPAEPDRKRRAGVKIPADWLLASMAILSALSVGYLVVATGGLTASPFNQFALTVILFGFVVAQSNRSYFEVAALGGALFAALYVIVEFEWVQSSEQAKGPVVYFGVALANLGIGAVLNYTLRPRGHGRASSKSTSEGVSGGATLFYSFIDTSDPGVVQRYSRAFRRLLDLADYELVDEEPGKWGSWFKTWLARARSSDAPKKLAQGVAQAASDTYMRQPGASATHELAQAAKVALDAMGDNEGCQVFDNLIVGKRRAPSGSLTVFVKELSLDERRVIRESPGLINSPARILAELEARTGATDSFEPRALEPGPDT